VCTELPRTQRSTVTSTPALAGCSASLTAAMTLSAAG
jgi:hypothetical protein